MRGVRVASRRAKTSASHLLADRNLTARIQYLVDRRVERLVLEQDRVVFELLRIGFSDLHQVMTYDPDAGLEIHASDDWPDHAAAGAAS